MKIRGSQQSRIRELYKKAAQEVQTSGTQFSKAVETAGRKSSLDVPRTEGPGKKSVQGTGAGDSMDKVEAKTEDYACQVVAQAPDIREARVNSIAEAIRNKTYKVDYEAVAERMLASGILDDVDES